MSQLIDITISEDELEGTEATISQWLFKVGEEVAQGEPIVELETDKVSMEICAPQAGVLSKIINNPGEQVTTNSAIAQLSIGISRGVSPNEQPSENNSSKHPLISPAVRRLLKENNLEINNIVGTGRDGRVNRNDVMLYLETTDVQREDDTNTHTVGHSVEHSVDKNYSLKGKLIPHSKIRKTIAKNMVESLLHTSPHVTSVFEMNMSNIIEHRKWHKKEYADQGVKLTFTAYFLAAIVKAIKSAPEVNARFHQDALEIFSDINIGVGTALGNKGLVVPVIEQVQQMNLFDIAKALSHQTTRAREGKLKPSEMRNGTFTISNHGVSGSLFAAPIIINQPEVAILGIGKMEKRVVVEEINAQDTVQIRPMCYVSLSIDHRALDAFQTSQFLSTFVHTIETWGE
jgi:2-oxoglutarate dehydrogenase E2 component (dihydrolipoamide succinyltransferase)